MNRFTGGRAPIVLLLVALVSVTGCGHDSESGGEAGHGRHAAGERSGGQVPRGGGETSAAVPVEVVQVERRSISSYIETNGTLEAENEVDIVARVAAPIVELKTEEGMAVRAGQLLARLDAAEYRAQQEIYRVSLDETRAAYERARELQGDKLISAEEFERAKAAFEGAKAQFERNEIDLGYTEIRSPFDGMIVRRYVDLAQSVSVNTPLFRISDFTPLLCPIQVPERSLSRLRNGQRGYVTVESYPGERFVASVLRISPVVDAASGTVKVTLDVDRKGKLRPGMFARVFVQTESRDGALVIPKAALSLESIGDTIYVERDGVASRREVTLGFHEGDYVEVVSGVAETDRVVVVGQDGLSDGTPIRVVTAGGEPAEAAPAPESPGKGGRGPGDGLPDFSKMTDEQIERFKQRMRDRGMTDEQIEERLKRFREKR
jgi:RND family efflux transporter MFP subunit